jgi:hypothetical protein
MFAVRWTLRPAARMQLNPVARCCQANETRAIRRPSSAFPATSSGLTEAGPHKPYTFCALV